MPRYTEKAHFGQTVICESGTDKSYAPFPKVSNKEAVMGKTMKGGPHDISHSVSGASTVSYNDARKGSMD